MKKNALNSITKTWKAVHVNHALETAPNVPNKIPQNAPNAHNNTLCINFNVSQSVQYNIILIPIYVFNANNNASSVIRTQTTAFYAKKAIINGITPV